MATWKIYKKAESYAKFWAYNILTIKGDHNKGAKITLDARKWQVISKFLFVYRGGGIMRTIIAGGRNFTNTNMAFACLEPLIKAGDIIISGHASGADSIGELYAQKHKLKLVSLLMPMNGVQSRRWDNMPSVSIAQPLAIFLAVTAALFTAQYIYERLKKEKE